MLIPKIHDMAVHSFNSILSCSVMMHICAVTCILSSCTVITCPNAYAQVVVILINARTFVSVKIIVCFLLVENTFLC